jgi:hypothetical protein
MEQFSFAEGFPREDNFPGALLVPYRTNALGRNTATRVQGCWLAQIIGMRAFRRAQRPRNGLTTMAKRDPSSGTIMPQSGPDRRSVLMGTVSSAAAPVIARAAQTETRRFHETAKMWF